MRMFSLWATVNICGKTNFSQCYYIKLEKVLREGSAGGEYWQKKMLAETNEEIKEREKAELGTRVSTRKETLKGFWAWLEITYCGSSKVLVGDSGSSSSGFISACKWHLRENKFNLFTHSTCQLHPLSHFLRVGKAELKSVCQSVTV